MTPGARAPGVKRDELFQQRGLPVGQIRRDGVLHRLCQHSLIAPAAGACALQLHRDSVPELWRVDFAVGAINGYGSLKPWAGFAAKLPELKRQCHKFVDFAGVLWLSCNKVDSRAERPGRFAKDLYHFEAIRCRGDRISRTGQPVHAPV